MVLFWSILSNRSDSPQQSCDDGVASGVECVRFGSNGRFDLICFAIFSFVHLIIVPISVPVFQISIYVYALNSNS